MRRAIGKTIVDQHEIGGGVVAVARTQRPQRLITILPARIAQGASQLAKLTGEGIELTLNSDEMDWKVNGQSSLYFDAQAEKLKFRGDIEMLGGTISWSNVNAPDIDDIPNLSGRLTYIGPTGIYSGTIKTDQLIAGSAKISSALIDTIKADRKSVV